MRKQTTDPTIWDSQWQKRRFVWTKAHTAFAVFAVVGVLFIAFIGWRYFSYGGGTAAELRNDFNIEVFKLMEEYKPRYALYDQLSDPQTLLQQEQTSSSMVQLMQRSLVMRSMRQQHGAPLWETAGIFLHEMNWLNSLRSIMENLLQKPQLRSQVQYLLRKRLPGHRLMLCLLRLPLMR